jgi:hypothetical protein
MIDIDVTKIYKRSHGESRDDGMFVEANGSVGNVCRKLLEFMEAFENLRLAIASCGDCVRLRVGLCKSGIEPIVAAVVMAGTIDATSNVRQVFLSTDEPVEMEDFLVRALHDSFDTSQYIRRITRRLRRPAA